QVLTTYELPASPSDVQMSRAVALQGYALGAGNFARIEGCWYGKGKVFFCATVGGAPASSGRDDSEVRRGNGNGQVWMYDVASGRLTLIVEADNPADTDDAILDGPDNITISPRGGLIVCEDGGGVNFLRGVTMEGTDLLLPEGRRILRDMRVLTAVAFGAAAWAPLVAWNLDNADAGLRFQLVDRHPWAFHTEGLWFIAIQALLVTPLLFAALLAGGWRGQRSTAAASRYFALTGSLVVLGFFVLGFFADTERVSFHWPLPGYLALLPLLPAVLAAWPGWARRLTWITAALGLVATLGYYVAVSVPELRARAASEKWYPSNFAGWDRLAQAVRDELADMPADTQLVADNFKLGAELGFALGDASIPVLDHPLNHRHGRAPQLRLWGLQTPGRQAWSDAPVLLVVGASEVSYKHLLRHFHTLCEMVGPLPPPRVLNVDHGRQRFLLFRLDQPRSGDCVAPAMAWIDHPAAGAVVPRDFELAGWAFKEGVGLEKVEVLLNGEVLGPVGYGLVSPGVQAFWQISNDPQHPAVGLRGHLDLGDIEPGRHWLGLRLYGRDGSIEDWPEQPIVIEE
ncbi:MAG: PhoX family protein, partial [Proteobacteria bacterium]|nr:PhoX family protein [Pseudomonadota bacterium]